MEITPVAYEIEPASEAFVSFDSTGHVLRWSEIASDIFGWEKEEVIGKEIIPLLFPSDVHGLYYKSLNYFLASGESDVFGRKIRIDLIDREGNRVPTEARINPVPAIGEEGGYTFHVFISAENQSLTKTDLANNANFAGAHDALIAIDNERKIISWNQAAADLYKYQNDEVQGKKIEMLLPSDASAGALGETLLDYVRESLTGESFKDLEIPQRTKEGNVINLLTNINPIINRAQQIVGVAIAAKDLSEQQSMEDELNYLQDHDVLTKLPNRYNFAKSFDRILEAEGSIGSIVILDIDHFKLINDSYGHEIGDSVIQIAAGVLRSAFDNTITSDNVRAVYEGMVAHFGGDEFILLLPNQDLDSAERIANGLIEIISTDVYKKYEINLSISAGVASYDSAKKQNAETKIIAADTALFEAKESGRGKTILHDTQKTSRLDWAEKLRNALDEGNLVLYQQPISNIRTGKIERYELLLRMQIDDKVHSPAPFLETADRLGLIGEVDRFVVKEGIELAATGKTVEINLSAKALNNKKLIEYVDDLIQKTNCSPENVIFEITETSAVANFVEATELIKRLTRLGCQFSLDDFGTGFSSFSYLKNLPVSGIKIDGEFVRNIAKSHVDQRIVSAIVMIAEALEKETVAEWVGDQETLDLLKDMGVDYAQGYLIGEPAPISEIIE